MKTEFAQNAGGIFSKSPRQSLAKSLWSSLRSGVVLGLGLVGGFMPFDGTVVLAQSATAPGKRVLIPRTMDVQVAPSTVEVSVPPGCVSCVVEARLRGRKTWLRWRSFAVKSGQKTVVFSPPANFRGLPLVEEWRASGMVDLAKAEQLGERKKYPLSFYKGAKTFGATPAAGYKSGLSAGAPADQGEVLYSVASPVSSVRTASVTADTASKPAAKAEEADIWKTDGNTVYFFNQLRGLQVMDLSDPSKPIMRARLRLPAVGQDLYLLPEQVPGERLVVLLTRAYDDVAGSQTEVIVVRVSGNKAEIASRQSVAGNLQDSRMVGSRLFFVNIDWSKPTYGAPIRTMVMKSAAGEVSPAVVDPVSSNVTLNELVVGADGSLALAASHSVPTRADSALISAGGDWLAVSSSTWWNWDSSQISLYRLSEDGADLLTQTPVQTKGRVYDKFKVSFQKDTLLAVTQRWDSGQVTTLENFNASGAPLNPLEVIRGENLFATRFTEGRLYVVTAVTHDPLWVVDISDPANPVMEGHVEIPGFSTYIEPVGEDGRFLFSIGWDGGKVVASLFDVSDPKKPIMPENGRVQVSEDGWGYSEAIWDEKALRVLPEDGLALIPFSGGWWNNNKPFMRLVDIDVANGGSLKLRGKLEHDFAPRRATLTNGVLTSISQKELITANISDRDNPALLAEVALAWPVNQILQTGDYLLQIADGSSAYWSNEPGSVVVTKADSEDNVLKVVELGSGKVCDSVVRGSKLYVLRRTTPVGFGFYPMVMRIAVMGGDASSPAIPKEEVQGLALDVYDISKLPEVNLLGSATAAAGEQELNNLITGLHWINDTTPAVLTQGQTWKWDWYSYPTMARAVPAVGTMTRIMPPRFYLRSYQPNPAVIRSFDVSKADSPAALKPVALNSVTDTFVSVSAAGDGLFVYAYGEKPALCRIPGFTKDGEEPVSATHRLGVVDFADLSNPITRAPTQMPGRVFAVTDLSRSGFLAYTETLNAATTTTKAVREVQVSVVDDSQAILIARTAVSQDDVLAAELRSLYVVGANAARRLSLEDSAVFLEAASTALPWTPSEIQTRGLTLLGVNGNNLMRISWNGPQPAVETWKMRQWFALSKMTIGVDRTIYAPMGDFGVERFGLK